jgi:hypothetical protein
LPVQIEGDLMDVRGMMHRDGSVFSCVSIEDLKNPDTLYRALGKLTMTHVYVYMCMYTCIYNLLTLTPIPCPLILIILNPNP